MSVNKESILTGEEITFTYGATDYWIGIDRDGSRILTQNVPASGFTTSFSEPGQYSAYVSCSNTNGFVDSNRVSFTVNSPKYYLDVNGYLDGNDSGGLGDYGTVDVYINWTLDADDVADYYKELPIGTVYEIKDIKPRDGNSYNGIRSGSRIGTIENGTTDVRLDFSRIQTGGMTQAGETTFDGNTYRFYSDEVTWYTAKRFCEEQGGHLVTIGSEEENSAAQALNKWYN